MASVGLSMGPLMLPAVLFVSAYTVMFHGPPPVKIKREPTPSKDLSPCRKSPMPFREKCLYSYRFVATLECLYSPSIIRGVLTMCCFIYSACDRKPTPGFKPETLPSTPASPCGPTGPAGTHPLSERTPPPHPHVANPTPGRHPVHLRQPVRGSAGSPEQPVQGHSPPFVVPCASINQHASSLASEPR